MEEKGERLVILFGDGERTVSMPPPALRSEIPVHTVVIGETSGGMIPGRQDPEGGPAISRVEPERMAAIAADTGGQTGVAGSRNISPGFVAELGPVLAATPAQTTLLAAGACLLLLLRWWRPHRRFAWLAAGLVLGGLLACTEAAETGRTVFRDATNLAASGRHEEAAERFQTASQMLAGEERALALYNAGTLLATIGMPKRAIPLLEESLILAPGEDATRGNLLLALEMLEKAPADGDSPADAQGDSEESSLTADQALELVRGIHAENGLPVADPARQQQAPRRDW